jgi:hypothetical protein
MELDNLTLEVIPELRLMDRGLVDVRAGSFVDVVLGTGPENNRPRSPDSADESER